ncbi:response regulator [bacterium]|nr:response regulator [bacterium]
MLNVEFPPRPVLLVDDEESWLVSMRMLLKRKLGINNVVFCTDSREVSMILASQPVSLVLLDYTMPYLNAEQVLAEIKPDNPDIPVIVLTGQDHLDLAERCMGMGAFDHFTKTSGTENILAGVKRALHL